jgi:hypothetical protein
MTTALSPEHIRTYTLATVYGVLKEAILHKHDRNLDIVLSDPRVNPSVEDNEYLMLACTYGNLYAVKRLLSDPRVNVAARGNTAFHISYSNEHWDILSHLSEHVGIHMMKP